MRDQNVYRRNLILREAEHVFVCAGELLPVAIRQRHRIERIFHEVAADGEERPRGAIRVFRPVAAEVAGDLPAVDHLSHLGLFRADRLLRGGDAFVNRLPGFGVESCGRELRAGLDAEFREPRDNGCVGFASGIVRQ